MLKSIKLTNFKSLDMAESLSLGKLSIICGSNSSGKSSVIQSLLMLSQTLSSRYSEDAVVLNGHLTRLGSFEDIKSHNSRLRHIVLEFDVEISKESPWSKEIGAITARITFGKTSKNPNLDDDLHPALLNAEFKIKNKYGDIYEEDKISIYRSESSNESQKQEHYKIECLETPETEQIAKEFPEYKIISIVKDGFFPDTLLLDYNHTKKISSQVLAAITKKDLKRLTKASDLDDSNIFLPSSFFAAVKQKIMLERREVEKTIVFPKVINDFLKLKNNKVHEKAIKKQLIDVNFPLDPEIIDPSFISNDHTTLSDWYLFLNDLDDKFKKLLIEFIDKHRVYLEQVWCEGTREERRESRYRLRSFTLASTYLSMVFSRSIKYLGPLRNEPLAVYPSIGQIEPTNIGLKGEFTAAVLHINKNKRIKYSSPVEENDGKIYFQKKEATLIEACTEWLSYLGVVKEVLTKDKGKLGYEIYVRSNPLENWQDLTHVGVGVSQVLPIITMSLLSEPDDILIFEQPELHLHPKVQSRLCDFFLCISQFDRQCIIETHSEYLINRLRLRIVQSRNASIETDSPIYFIEKNSGISEFRNIKITKFGSIIDWPEEFFDQTDHEVERILIEATRKKKEEKL